MRHGADTYRHASGRDFQDVEDNARKGIEAGFRHVRVQVRGAGPRHLRRARAPRRRRARNPRSAPPIPARIWEPGPYVRMLPKLFEHLRKKLGDEVELLHDVHERVPPILAMQLCKELEPYRLFFLEDPFTPEDIGYFGQLRQQTSTPIAMGELFNTSTSTCRSSPTG